MEKKDKYLAPEIELTLIACADVISTSGLVEAPPDSGDIDQGSWS